MAERYVQLWKGVTSPTDEAQAVRALTDLVSDSAGRAFALNLESEDAVLCIEALDYVSLRSAFAFPFAASRGIVRASQNGISTLPLGPISSSC